MNENNEVQNVPSDAAHMQRFDSLCRKWNVFGTEKKTAKLFWLEACALLAQRPPLTVSLSHDPRGVHVAVNQGSECVHADKRSCARSHPHENMSPECEAKTVKAREANAKRCAEVAAKPAQDEREKPVVPDNEDVAQAWVSASDCDGIAYDGPSFEAGYRAALSTPPMEGDALDAARYRWLRKQSTSAADIRVSQWDAPVYRAGRGINGENLDRAVDAAIAAMGNKEPT